MTQSQVYCSTKRAKLNSESVTVVTLALVTMTHFLLFLLSSPFPSLSAGPKVACSVELLMLHTLIQEISINADAVGLPVWVGLKKRTETADFCRKSCNRRIK